MAVATVTTGRKSDKLQVQEAQRLAAAWGLLYVPREGRSLEQVRAEAAALGASSPAVIVVQPDGLCLHVGEIRFRYHPGMGLSRIRRLARGERDWMLWAMDLREGDQVLDATMGLASDLLVASYAVGERGRAVGLESELLIALIVKEGLASYSDPSEDVVAAMRRIEVIHGDHRGYLRAAPSGSFDVVYFDPLFHKPIEASSQIAPIRELANPAPLEDAVLKEAARVARRRVVVKDRRDGPYATSGRFDEVVGGKKSRICFCVLRVDGAQRETTKG